MINDIATIIWKEARELFLQRPNFRGGWMGLLVMLGVFGIFIPVQNGPDWISSPANLAIWGWVPYLLVSGIIADSFAGERERHTLETLLASRLSDQAILFGKIGAGIVYGWGLTLVSVLLGLITINIVHWNGSIRLYPPLIGLGIIGLSFLVSAFAAGLGVLVSLRASTVRQAQQTFSLLFFLFFIPLLLLPMLPEEVQFRIFSVLQNLNVQSVIIGITALLLVVDIVLIAAAMARFRRARLILD